MKAATTQYPNTDNVEMSGITTFHSTAGVEYTWKTTTQRQGARRHLQLQEEARMWFFQNNQNDKTTPSCSDKKSETLATQTALWAA